MKLWFWLFWCLDMIFSNTFFRKSFSREEKILILSYFRSQRWWRTSNSWQWRHWSWTWRWRNRCCTIKSITWTTNWWIGGKFKFWSSGEKFVATNPSQYQKNQSRLQKRTNNFQSWTCSTPISNSRISLVLHSSEVIVRCFVLSWNRYSSLEISFHQICLGFCQQWRKCYFCGQYSTFDFTIGRQFNHCLWWVTAFIGISYFSKCKYIFLSTSFTRCF